MSRLATTRPAVPPPIIMKSKRSSLNPLVDSVLKSAILGFNIELQRDKKIVRRKFRLATRRDDSRCGGHGKQEIVDL